MSNSTLSARSWRWIGALAFATVIIGAYPSMPKRVLDWDNAVKLHVAHNWLRGRGPVVTAKTPDDALYIYRAPDGRAFSSYPPAAIGLHFLTLGVEGLGAQRSEGVPTLALLGWLAWILVAWGRRSGVSPVAAVAGAMLVCLGTMLWPMAVFGYQNLVDTFGLAVLLWASAGTMRGRDWFWAGAAFGLACITRFGSGGLIVPALLLLPGRSPWKGAQMVRRGAAFILGGVPFLAILLWYSHLRTGNALDFGRVVTGTLAEPGVRWFSKSHWQAMAGLVASPGKGILWYTPPFIGVVAFAVPLWRRYRASFAALGLYALAVVVVLAGRLPHWHGDWAWGPRYMAPLCLAVAPLAWWICAKVELLGQRMRMAMVVCFFLLLALQAIPVTGNPVDVYFGTTLPRLAANGELATSPMTKAPVPADNAVLYFRMKNSPIVAMLRVWTAHLPVAPLSKAALVPVLALGLVLLTARLTEKR